MDSRLDLLFITHLGQQLGVSDMGKKKFQKLIYLLETVEAEDLGYRYEIYIYGPFSRTLDDDLRNLSMHGLLDYRKHSGSYLVNITDEGREVLKNSVIDSQKAAAAERILKTYGDRSPRDLEILTTAFFTYLKLENDANRDRLLECVTRIKGHKFDKEAVSRAVDEALVLHA